MNKTIKQIEVENKAKELYNGIYLCGDSSKQCTLFMLDYLIKDLESIPKLTVCEFEGQKCYGIIDFYK